MGWMVWVSGEMVGFCWGNLGVDKAWIVLWWVGICREGRMDLDE